MPSGKGPASETQKAARSDDGRKEASPQRRRKLSFNEKHALETLPAAMDKLHREIAALQNTLSDAGLYAKDPKTFEAATARLTTSEAELAAAEERWLELELLREELES